MIYLVLSILCILIAIGLIFFLLYLIKDEKKLKEVSTNDLKKFNKVYTKQEFEDEMFNHYSNILKFKIYNDYQSLKDAVADNIYNQMLLEIKNEKDNYLKSNIDNINKEFSKLISFEELNGIEIAKLWIGYNDIEYTSKQTTQVNENGMPNVVEEVVKGSKDTPTKHEYIITFVKERSDKEDFTCPGCGYTSNIALKSKCIRCENDILEKKKHWVYIGKEIANFNK